ncbi:MAG: Gx transporter family protein [Ruminococcaceae bacterium]|nr:Gx transporter family protein [Oscillospiraceae bacterium]
MTDIKKKCKKLALISVITALCMIISYVEFLFPFSFAVPGIKLGLSNIVVLFSLVCLGKKEAFVILFLKIALNSLLFTGISSFLFSFMGGVLSFLIMVILHKLRFFSVIGISAAGGVFHNIGQLVAASIVTKSLAVFYYFPVLLIVGTITGTLTGFICSLLIKKINIFVK